jgi:leader peptidase (prepilin peptidase)/N-methyltransferase
LAAVVAAAAVGFLDTLGPVWALFPYAGFLLLTTALIVTDIDSMRIVDRLNLRGSVLLIVLLGVSSALDQTVPSYGRALLGGVAFFGGSFLLFALVRGRGFGAGDVKLAAVLGVFSGYLGWVVLGRAAFFTASLGGLVAIVALAFFKARRDTELPYGPSMILGAWIAIVVAGIGSGAIPA